MRNILLNPPTKTELEAILAKTEKQPMLPKLGNPIWKAVSQRPHLNGYVDYFIDKVREEVATNLPILTEEHYTSFHLRGERLEFDQVYQERRRLFTQSALAALLADDPGYFLPVVFERWESTLDEESWAFSAHVTNPTGRDPRSLDLKACETANTIAEFMDIFSSVAPPKLIERSHTRIQYMIDVFLDGDESPWGWFRSSHNWNAVCHQGIIGAALNAETQMDRLVEVLLRMANDLPNFLNGFTEDGGCSEGPSYWGYGFGWFCWLNEQLEKRTQGALSLFHENETINRIARYGIHFHVPPASQLNFADCHAFGNLPAGLIAYLGKRLNDPLLKECADALYAEISRKPRSIEGQNVNRKDFFNISRELLYSPDMIPEATVFPTSDCVYPDLGVWNVRGYDASTNINWSAAAKGGHNAEHHNHNDCGSFVVHLNGIPMISEIGMPEYVKRYFRADRYSFLASRSLGHSVPLINGCEQRAGKEFMARILNADTGEYPEFAVELVGAYPESAACTSALRKIIVSRDPFSVTASDEITLSERFALETALITFAEVKTKDETSAILQWKGQTLSVEVNDGTRIDRIEPYEFLDRDGVHCAVNRLVFTSSNAFQHKCTLSYNMVPKSKDSA